MPRTDDQPARAKGPRAARALKVGVPVLAVTALFLWYIGVFGGNVRTVVPGRVFRSAQLTGSTLDGVLKSRGIRTVIDLRGGSMRDSFYRSEIAECRANNVDHFDIPFSARFLPPPERMSQLLHALDTAPYPVLMHCNAGADRAGLASTIYLAVYQHVPLDTAEHRMLTWRYGHFSFGIAHAMDDFFNLYRRTSGGLGLRAWIETRYAAVYAQSAQQMPDAAGDLAPGHAPAVVTHPGG